MDHGETSVLEKKAQALRDLLRELEEAVICFSGGVDSSYLLAEAVRAQGAGAVALTAVSPSLTSEEGEDARRLADRLGARHLLVETFEVDDYVHHFCGLDCYSKWQKKKPEEPSGGEG